MSELILRFLSSIFILLLACLAFSNGKITFYFLVAIIAIIQYFELFRITGSNTTLTLVLGLFLIAIPCGAIAYLYEANKEVLIWMTFCIWTTDVICYLVGKKHGKTKINPKISPGKSWEGFLAGMAASTLVGMVLSYCFSFPCLYYSLSALVALISQAGDFLESSIKRFFEVKDSGKLIPGHGGVMDRMDGFIICAPLIACSVLFF